MTNVLSIQFENAVRLLTEKMPPADENSRKPILFHDIRVGVYLYENGYSEDVVVAGVLHDALEWSSITADMLEAGFGQKVFMLVSACTKDDSIADKFEKTNELVQRCVTAGQDALIIKTADILDSFKWYTSKNNEGELKYCMRNADAIFKFKPDAFNDRIFVELKNWQEKYRYLSE